MQNGHQGAADLRVTADSEKWIGLVATECSLLWAWPRLHVRIKGSPKRLVAFGKRFPSRVTFAPVSARVLFRALFPSDYRLRRVINGTPASSNARYPGSGTPIVIDTFALAWVACWLTALLALTVQKNS